MFGRERTGTPTDLLVVGLGNPGAEYSGTRHNVGAQVIDLLVSRHRGKLKVGRVRALSDELRIGPNRLVVAIPQTYMNLSGESVRPLVRRQGVVDLARLVVIHDELDLPVGRVKLKFGGGTAGHNGLKSIQAHVGTPDFARIRIGVGRPPGQQAGADYVLKRPGKADSSLLDVAVEVAADAVESILTEGFDRVMNQVNTLPG